MACLYGDTATAGRLIMVPTGHLPDSFYMDVSSSFLTILSFTRLSLKYPLRFLPILLCMSSKHPLHGALGVSLLRISTEGARS